MNVFVTGASGGIGYTVVEYFANKGVRVFACDVRERKFLSENVTFFKADVSDEKDVARVAELLKDESVTLDAIVNIAGIFLIDSLIELESDELRKIVDVNLLGAAFVNKFLHPILKKDGRILITTSEVAPLEPLPFNSIYSTTKTALDCYAQGLRQELNLLGQRVITIRPGAFRTPLAEGSLEKTAELAEKTKLYAVQSKNFYTIVKTFMGKPLPPEKIAPLYYRALVAKRPKLVYSKHLNPLLLLMNILPKRLQCFAVKTLLR